MTTLQPIAGTKRVFRDLSGLCSQPRLTFSTFGKTLKERLAKKIASLVTYPKYTVSPQFVSPAEPM